MHLGDTYRLYRLHRLSRSDFGNMLQLALPRRCGLEISAVEARAANKPGHADHSAASLLRPLALAAQQKLEVVGAAAGQHGGGAHGICRDSGATWRTFGAGVREVVGIHFSQQHRAFDSLCLAAWDNSAASLSDVRNRVLQTGPVSGSR